jgi:hypothetical protein
VAIMPKPIHNCPQQIKFNTNVIYATFCYLGLEKAYCMYLRGWFPIIEAVYTIRRRFGRWLITFARLQSELWASTCHELPQNRIFAISSLFQCLCLQNTIPTLNIYCLPWTCLWHWHSPILWDVFVCCKPKNKQLRRSSCEELNYGAVCSMRRRNLIDLARHHHLVGVQPLGTGLSQGVDNIRSSSLGKLSILEDSLVLEVISYLGARDLINLSACSRGCYCFSNHEDIWKALTIEVRTFEYL